MSIPWNLLKISDLERYTRTVGLTKQELVKRASEKYDNVNSITIPVFELITAANSKTVDDAKDIALDSNYYIDEQLSSMFERIEDLYFRIHEQQIVPDILMSLKFMHPVDILSLCTTSTKYNSRCTKQFWCEKAIVENILTVETCELMSKDGIINEISLIYDIEQL